ncbi:MAG TPA: SDR family NAD(P)-dependent oxidoreductase [Rhizomicrobium sp.]|nr:SDR family NAD(P)-dependent oxidoreductase [Rhizomicrobium sp.]
MATATAELKGKTAIVTGGTRGIGRAIAERFLKAGANVVITGRDAKKGMTAAEELDRTSSHLRCVPADQARDADWSKVVDAALSGFGRLDILVANAGLSYPSPAIDITLHDFRAINAANLKGTFLGLKHATAAMRRHGEGGSIILLASIVGIIGSRNFLHYAASKGGVRLMAKAAALELGPEKIRVNSIHPGLVKTDMTERFDEKVYANAIPMGRFAQPSDIAGAALFLAGPRSQFVTGSQVVVDGGFTIQ